MARTLIARCHFYSMPPTSSLFKAILHGHTLLRNMSTCTSASDALTTRYLGQPTAHTHSFLMKKGEVTPGFTKEDYAERRNLLMKSLNIVSSKSKATETFQKSAIILFGESITYMSEDIPYPFHQNTNFRYLTGFLEPESCLIMESEIGSGPSQYIATLLVQERDPHKELWHGPRAGTEGALHHTGVLQTENIDTLPEILKKILSENCDIWYDFRKATNMKLHMEHMRPFLTEAFNKKLKIRTVSDAIHQLRHIKSEKEISLLMEAGRITGESLKRTIPVSCPEMNEGTIQALIDCECRVKGAQMLAYPPVVAGGNRANTLHYIFNNQRIKDGEMVLVDAGAEYHGYVADITRTWPINGKFTSAQRKLYESVLKVQRMCISLCKPSNTLDQIYSAMCMLLVQELTANNILKKEVKSHEVYEVARKYCPHHVGHWLGMDVHDTQCIPRSTPLQSGMVVTIEPGVYIRDDDIDVLEEYRGIGIRIEDDVVVTSGDPLVLTASCPKDIDDIEKLMSATR